MTDHSYSASTSSTWYIDSGASSHMTGAHEMFSKLSQADTDVEVVLGDGCCVGRWISSQCSWMWDHYISEGVHESHGIAGCIVCTWAEEEPSLSFHDQGSGSWGVFPIWTCAYASQDYKTICFSCYWS